MDQLYARLQTMDLENEELVVDNNSVPKVENRVKKCHLLKLLTTKYYNREAFRATMRQVWRSVKAIRFYDMGESFG